MELTGIFIIIIAFSGGLISGLLFDELFASPFRRRRYAKQALKQLSRNLHDSRDIYQHQLQLKKLLENSLTESVPLRWQSLKEAGFNTATSSLYKDMSSHQRELLMMIRKLSEQSIYRLNIHLLEWVDENHFKWLFTASRNSNTTVLRFKKELLNMQLYLKDWFGKFETEFLSNPEMPFVFCLDTDGNKENFPKELIGITDEILSWYGQK